MFTDEQLGAAAAAMFEAERLARSRHGLTEGDCRVLARLALQAAWDARPPIKVTKRRPLVIECDLCGKPAQDCKCDDHHKSL